MAVSDVWKLNPPWASAYAFGIDRPWLARPVAKLMWGSDIGLLYDARKRLGTLPSGTAVLDVPSGSGVALRGIQPGQGLRYVAADIAPTMVKRTRESAEQLGIADQVEAVQADVENLEFGEAEFDVAVSFTGLHCFSHPEKAITELARVVKPGGKLWLSWLRSDAGVRYLPQLALGRASGLIGPSVTTGEVRRWLIATGFADIELDVSGALAYVTAVRE